MSNIAVEIKNLTKTYKLYPGPMQMALDKLGFYYLRFWKKRPDFPVKHALNDISFNIEKGKRYGLIGRNGAGKTTLLKSIAGFIHANNGKVILNGTLQSLMQIGGEGFHPEFSGRDNVRFSLLYKGLSGDALEKAYNDVVEFSELGEFINQPIKTYSLGMQSRLKFAVSTVIQPDIILIDEVLGAGDAYFSTKSIERMKQLTNNGCTLILVSHSKSQILEFCNEGIWLDNGTVRMTGEVNKVMKAYEEASYKATNSVKIKPNDTALPLAIAPNSMKRDYLLNSIQNSAPHLNWRSSSVDGFFREGTSSETLVHIKTVQPEREGIICNWFETGDNVTFQIQVENNSNEAKEVSIGVLFYGHNGDKIAGDQSPTFLLEPSRKKSISQNIPQLPLGHRDYLACFYLQQEGKIMQTLAGMYIKVNETNDTDPPLLHYSAKWYQSSNDKPFFSRISGIQ
jgi:ABC-type polysaccharide/polyol phosphate transport system ATPase subunit